MHFGTVLWIVVLVVAPIAIFLFAGAWGVLDEIGRGGLATDDAPPRPAAGPGRPPTPMARAEQEAEIRQFVQARHDRQLARGDSPVDVDAEVSRLLTLDAEAAPADGYDADQALREEVRQLVIARNYRRAKRGEPALDVEAEVDRQLLDLRG